MGTARMTHPVTGDVYSDENGNVRVNSDGRTGLFQRNGAWISGDVRRADPMMCIWIAGHNFGDSVPFRNQRLQKDHGVGEPAADREEGTS